MFQSFPGTKTHLPSYSLIRAVPNRGLPKDLEEQEASADHQERRDQIERELSAQGSHEDEPGFLTFLKSGNGLLQLHLPQTEGGCLLAFSTPFRAADYASVAAPKREFQYFCSSPTQVVSVTDEFRERAGVRRIALDRCSRCETFTSIDVSSFASAANVIRIRNIFKATEVAR
jgi:hypothetical protein